MLLELSHKQEKAVRYIDRARAKGSEAASHPVLAAMNVNGAIETADGFRYHAVDVQLGVEGLLAYDRPGPILKTSPQDGTYPDIDRLLPTDEPSLVIGINARFLREALTGLEDMAVLRFYSAIKPMEVLGTVKTKKGTEKPPAAYALIMPMHMANADNAPSWRPHQAKGEDNGQE